MKISIKWIFSFIFAASISAEKRRIGIEDLAIQQFLAHGEKHNFIKYLVINRALNETSAPVLAYGGSIRNFVSKRQAEGIAAAKLRGVRFGCYENHYLKILRKTMFCGWKESFWDWKVQEDSGCQKAPSIEILKHSFASYPSFSKKVYFGGI